MGVAEEQLVEKIQHHSDKDHSPHRNPLLRVPKVVIEQVVPVEAPVAYPHSAVLEVGHSEVEDLLAAEEAVLHASGPVEE